MQGQHSNYIPILPLEDPTSVRTTTEKIRPDTTGNDRHASEWEEQHNSVDKRDIDTMIDTQLKAYEVDVAHMQNVVQNLT